MPGDAANVRGPCSSCGAQLAIDQRYCVECGQRVGPPLALPYAPAVVPALPPTETKWLSALPMPIQMVGAFAALSLGFGAVVGTAISPNLDSIVAAPAPLVAEAPPPTEAPPTGGGGGGGTAEPSPASAPAAPAASSPSSGSSGGGGGAGGGGNAKKKKEKEQPEAPLSFTGTVVRVNPIAASYTISTGSLVAIHADTLPQVGQTVQVPVRQLANQTYAEDGARNAVGSAQEMTFSGTVTYCADLERPSAPCDGATATDHYAYSVSSLGASVLVDVPPPAASPPPPVGSQVQVTARIGAAQFQPIQPTAWASDSACTPAYNEQSGRPAEPVQAPALDQVSVNVTGQATSATAQAVLQTVCPGDAPKLVLSADDIRQAGRDLPPLAVPAGFDLARLTPGEAVQFEADIAPNGNGLSLKGITSDQGAAGAGDAAQGQGTLTGR